jgi:demethylmenaquinone methyltransferase / 2-methoxy-6-polyprenyl-1,4-benzoquinol methylase
MLLCAMPETTESIISLFDRLAPEYDRFNRLCSLGMDHFWRRCVLKDVASQSAVLDIGTGTGDLALGALKRVGRSGIVVALDPSAKMLQLARGKEQRLFSTPRIRWLKHKAEDLPLNSKPFDALISGFVLRNLAPQLDRAINGFYHSLKPGGRISFVDLTEPDNPLIRRMASAYFSTAVTLWGFLCFRKQEPVRYLRRSLQTFFRARDFCSLLQNAGFQNVTANRYLFGLITHYRGNR